ncbi:MarR family winged helix-turn-helix transcriptional regulator [Sulfurospirillum arcachonense]|uniref:MarR family winged helix-turn-helix transcriptional regulator n=1 Tax=Sulfurospirillum arcachonense TaxID=57666 RepID=UPI00046AA0DB|nr:MarR family transcriptional regulator [Sulfurospirillum arcachonense]
MKNTNSIIATIANIQLNANKLIINELKKHNLDGLAPSHGAILVNLYKNENGIAMKKLSVSINKDKSTLTALINKLVKMDLVEKVKDKNDSRSTLIKLTNKGLEIKPIILNEISSKLISKTYEGFSQKEKETLMDLLTKVKNNFLEN